MGKGLLYPLSRLEQRFFVSLENSLGSFICLNNNTTKEAKLDISRILVRVPISFSLRHSIVEIIDGKEFRITLREEHYGSGRFASGSTSKI